MLTLVHSEWPKLHRVLATLIALGLNFMKTLFRYTWLLPLCESLAVECVRGVKGNSKETSNDIVKCRIAGALQAPATVRPMKNRVD